MRVNDFLRASEYFSELDCFDHHIALKLRPYGGLIGIENSSLDKYLKVSKFYVCTLFYPTQVVSYAKHITKDLVILIGFRGNAATVLVVFCLDYFLLLFEDISSINFSFIGMLSSKTVVLDVEEFFHREENFFINEFGICTED